MADTKGVDALTMEGSFTRPVHLLSVVGKLKAMGFTGIRVHARWS